LNPDTLLKPDSFSSFARLKIRGKTWALYWVNFVLFLLLKTLIRPWVRENNAPDFIQNITFSFPNYVEAYLGTFTIATFFLIGKIKDYSFFRNLGNHAIYLLSISLAAIYVITQEMNVHSLGGNNIYDFNDIIASIIGLVVIYIMLKLFGTGIQKNQ
jgi:hypothetical protein